MRKATGSITPTRQGRYRLRLTVDGDRKTIDTYDSRREAERERRAALAVIAAELPTAGTLVGEWLDEHLGRREASRAFRDSANERAYFDRDVKSDPIARMPLRSVRAHDADEFIDRLRGKGHAVGTILKIKGIVNGGFRAAMRKELIKTNPFAGLSIAAQRRTEEPWTYANPTEQEALITAAIAHRSATPRLRGIPIDAMIEFAMGAGLRAGELVTLRLADVSIDGESPKVTVRYGTAPDLPTKTGRIREVPLFGRAVDGLRRWLGAMPSWASRNPDKIVFVGARGGFRDENHVIRWDDWKAILALAGITRRFRWHDLRHTCASALVSGFWGRRWALEEVMGMMGHTDIKTTQRYAHLAPTAVQNAARETAAKWSHAETAIVPKSSESKGAPGRSRISDQRFRKALHGAGEVGAFALRDRLASDSDQLLLAIAEGNASEVARLSRAIASPVAQLALDVLAGGPLAVAKAIELVEIVAPPSERTPLRKIPAGAS